MCNTLYVATRFRACGQLGFIALQDRYGSTPLHVAARCGALRIVDAICRAQPAALNSVDVRGNTPLDNAVAAGKRAAEAALQAAGGLPGPHPSLQAEQERMQKWSTDNENATSLVRLRRAQGTLPEPSVHIDAVAVAGAFRDFTKVRRRTPCVFSGRSL